MQNKICSKCNKKKLLRDFHKNKFGKQGRRSTCKKCVQIYYNPKYIKDREKYKWMAIKRIYGITEGDYNQLFNQQNGRCAICNRHQAEFTKALCIDHSHETGKIRGLLCKDCNLALGIYEKRKGDFEKYILIYE